VEDGQVYTDEEEQSGDEEVDGQGTKGGLAVRAWLKYSLGYFPNKGIRVTSASST
jgi:hypothetical protein